MKKKFYWSEEKEQELISMWGKQSLSQIVKYFHTTDKTILAKVEELNLKEYKSNRWTKEEEELLREYSKKYVTKTIARKLGRSYIAVQKKAIKLGIELSSEKDPWKKWMIDYLKDNINKTPIGEIGKILGLSYYQIIKKCKELNIEYVKESWTEEEIEILKKYAKTCHYTELTKVLPRRSVGAISAKAYELGIETISDYAKINEEHAKYVKDNWGKLSVGELAKNLNVSRGVIYRYKKELKLPNLSQKKKWTDDVIKKMRKDAKTKTRNELAKKYKTSPEQISTIARKHNIKLIDSKKIWNDELDEELIKLVKEEFSIPEISSKMNIKASTIRSRITKLGLKDKKPKNPNIKWTEDEVNLLKELSNSKSASEIATILNKAESTVIVKARKLNISLLKNHLWTDEDTNMLLSLHDILSVDEISEKMEMTEPVISKKAKELGIPIFYKERRRWTEEEEQMLISYASIYTAREIAPMLNRTVASVTSKLQYIGKSAKTSSYFWTEEETSKLIELSKDKNINEISLILNKSYESVKEKLYKLKIKNTNQNIPNWTKEEEETLQELLTSFSTFEIAKILDRSEESIRSRALKLGYDINIKNRRWTTDEEELLSDLWGDKPIEYIAKKLNRTESAIINRVHVLGLGSQLDNNYEGLRIQELADIFKIARTAITTSWTALGLKLSFKKRSNNSIYAFVTISDLYEFLENNQNIWDSRLIEKNLFGIEPEWLKEKREFDKDMPDNFFGLDNLNRQQLIKSNNYYLDDNMEEDEMVLVKKNKRDD